MSELSEKSSEILEKTTTMVHHAHSMLRENQIGQPEFMRIKQLESRVRDLHAFLKEVESA